MYSFVLRLFLISALVIIGQSRDLFEYTIDLDLAPEDRYLGLFDVPGNTFNETVWKFYDTYFKDHSKLTDVLYGLADARGPESEEQEREILGLSLASKLPFQFVKGIQMLYEIQTLMVPIVNFTGPGLPAAEDYPPGWFPPATRSSARSLGAVPAAPASSPSTPPTAR